MTATAQGQVIGKRHFGNKAVAAGGGGGRGRRARAVRHAARCGRRRVALDAQGRATLDDPAQRFADRASASSRSRTRARRRFGDGAPTVRTTQDLMLFSGLPPVVREQDEFSAMFTLRNATAQPLDVEFAWTRARPARRRPARENARQRRSERRARSERSQACVRAGASAGRPRAPVLGNRRERQGRRPRPAAHDAESDRSASGARVSGYARAARQSRSNFRSSGRPSALPGRGGVRVDVMGTLAGELSAVREYFCTLSVHLPRAARFESDRAWQTTTVGSARREHAELSRSRRACALFPVRLAARQRRADRVSRADRRRRRPRVAGGRAPAHAGGPRSFRGRPHRARQRAADRRSDRAQARSDRGAGASRPRQAGACSIRSPSSRRCGRLRR